MDTSSEETNNKDEITEALEKTIAQQKTEIFRLRNIIDNIPGDIYWKDKEGVWLGLNTTASESLRRMGFSWRIKEVVGKTDYDLFGKKTADEFRKNDLEVMQRGAILTRKEVSVLPSGEKITQLSAKIPLFDEKDHVVGIVGNTIDITDLAQHEENLLSMFPGHIYWKDVDGVYLGCNDEHAKSLGLKSRYEIIGKTDYDLSWRKHADDLRRLDKKVMDHDKTYIEEEKLLLANGQEVVYLSKKMPLKNKQGKVIGIMGTSIDITNRKEQEKKLKKAMIDAEKANRVKSEFIANMSHDIRTPITGILGLAKFLKDDAYTEQSRKNAQLLIGATEQLLSLLNEIIEVIRIEEGKLKNGQKDFDLITVVENNIELLQPALRDKGLRLNYHIDPRAPRYLFGYQLYLDRILLNLLGNAVKFTERGHISITVAVKKLKEMDEEVVLEIVVEDTGIGIPADKKEAIFEHFSRLSPSYEGRYTGYGLGLYTVKRYLEAMNGQIKVESELGKGSRFILTIPFKIGKVVSSEIKRVYEEDVASKRFSPELVKEISSEEKEIPSRKKVISSKEKEILRKGKKILEKETPNERTKILKKEIPSKAGKIPGQEDHRQTLLSPTGNSLEPSPEIVSRILLVEDNQLAALMATRLLAERHCEIVHVRTGTEALERAARERFDLILMDLGLPDQSGMEVTQSIRACADHPNADTPIVALTGHLTDDKREECLAVGMQDVLSKPLTALSGQQLLMKYGVPSSLDLTSKPSKAVEFSVIDLERGMNILGGDLAGAKEALEILSQSLPTDYQQIQAHYNDKDYEAMYQVVHRLYGGLCYCGTPSLQKFTHSLKQALLNKKIQELPRLMKHFKEEMERFQQAYQHLKRQEDI